MSFIIRLQNLPWSANAHDIREFFKGLSIPEGGVHIVGGELGDAFIAFSSDEDARLAMQKTGNPLKGIQITLLLSSRSEMQKVIETARQQALGMQSFMTPVAPVVPVQPVTPAQLPPPVVPQFQGPSSIQTHPQRITSDSHQPTNPNQNVFPGRPLQPNQHGQSFPQPFNAHQAPFANQMPFHGQKVSGFPPGVVVPQSGMPPHFYGQPPPVSVPSTQAPAMGHHVHNVENAPPQMSQNFSPLGHQASNYSMQPSQTQSQKDVEEDKKDKKPISSSTASRDKRDRDSRDNKGRDDRRRRSKSRSRSRSKDRDRRRRHRSRSRSRSRDKGSRRRRSRSRDRDRGRDVTRDKERDRQRDRKDTRSYRDKSERSSQETSAGELQPPPQVKVAENSGGIPGLGEIPDDIPKEGLSIFTQPSTAPVQTKETPPSAGWLKPTVQEPQPFSHHPHNPENLPPPKPFLLASPPNMNPGPYSSNPPLLADPPLIKKPPNVLPFNNQSGGPPGNYKPPLLQKPKDEGAPPRDYPPEDRRDWPPQESFERRKFRDDDRGYRGQNHGRDRSYDSPKPPPPPHAREGGTWENPKESDKEHHAGEWGRPFPRREDEYGYSRDKDGSRNPDQGMPDRRDHHMYATRTFGGGGGNFPNEYNGEYDDRYSRGGFRGRGRRGFGRDDRMPPDPPRMGSEEHPLYRERYPPDFERGRGGRGILRGRGAWGPPMGDYPRERRPKTCSVELRNVPLNASHGAIRELFNGLIVPNGGIKILGGQRGERIGVALIQFGSTRDAYEATKMSGSFLFDSRVMVLYIDDAIFEDAKDIGLANNDNNIPEGGTEQMDITSPCVYVSGLPIGCTDHDVSRLFEGFKAEDIVLELEKGSRQPSGGCFVRFNSPEEAENTLSQLKRPNIDGAPVKIEMCSLEAMEAAAKEREKIKNKPPPPPPNQEKTNPSEIGTKEHLMALTQHLKNNDRNKKTNSEENIDSFNQNGNDSSHKKGADLLTDSIVIKNVSSDITETSIRDFLSDEGLIPEKVYFNRPDSEGKSDVFVVFPKISDAKHAIKKNSQLLGSSEVTVQLISKPTVMQAMGMPFDPRELFQKGHSEKRPSGSSHSDNNENEAYPDSRNYSPSPHHDNQYRDRSYNPKYGRHNDPHQGGFRPRTPFTYRREHDRHPPERGNYEERVPESNGSEAGKSSAAPPQDFGKPGCVVALANLPYLATTEDILTFFKDFDNLLPENIIRRYDERNRPTSDSRVSLPSPEEAQRAVKTLNRQVMLGRTIYLSLVN